jgi:hypothetical protein
MLRKLLVNAATLGEAAPPAGKTNVTLKFGGHTVHFKTDKTLASQWPILLAANPPGQIGGPADLLKHDLLALVGLAVGAAGGLGVCEVLGGDVHPRAVGGQAAGRDVDCVKQAHQLCPIPIAFSRIDSRWAATWVSVW